MDAVEALLDVRVGVTGDAGSSIMEVDRDRVLSDLGEAIERVSLMQSTWAMVCARVHGDSPVARWVSWVEGRAGKVVRLSASPTSAAQTLDEELWQKACAVVICSATLKGVGGFRPVLRETGMDRTSLVETLSVESPFALSERGVLMVPETGVSAKDSKAHTAMLIEKVPLALRALREGSGALMIFNSLSQMREVAEAMPEWVKSMLLVQGDMSKSEMLKRHSESISKRQSSLLFGSKTFEAGVDLAGRLCEMVLIAKLPFDPPSGAVETVRRNWIEARGGNYFREVTVPAAGRRLAQRFGRLIRTETDSGIVVVFDERLTKSPYSGALMDALPPFSVEARLPGEVPAPW
jgi:ATP-dependent DNA helicase DinG